MISDKMAQAMNEQINAELYSAYLYLSMATWLDSQELPGFSHWMMTQVQEEMAHALKLYKHLVNRGGRAVMKAIAAPETDWQSPLECFQAVADHEAKVTGLINNLVTLARAENDYASENFLQWYVSEQVEEESSAAAVIGQLKLVDQTKGGLFMLDKEMAARVFTMPVGLTI